MSFRSLSIGVVVVALSSLAGAARAQSPAPSEAPAAGGVPAPTDATAQPLPPPEAAPSALDTNTLAAAVTESPSRGPNVSYGVAARLRWVSVPKWMLNLFTKRNVPLSSWSSAIELMRRKGEFDFIVSIGYQSMSPPDGNWLGKSNNPAIDTDYVQFKGLGFWGVDASFVWHTFVNDWFGMHYGAGLGLGIVTGKMLRTSNAGCTDANAGDFTQCKPIAIPCTPAGCSDAALAGTMGSGVDDPTDPHRFADPNVPPALPIVNVLLGVDFRLPRVRGWEAKIEGGFYDAFFLGGGVGYTF